MSGLLAGVTRFATLAVLLPISSFSLLPMTALAQEGLKVLISADMEGIGGVSTSLQASPSGSEYQKFRRLMTLEVNAAVEGAFEAGATEVVVADSHGNAQNIDPELLDPRASLIRSWPRPLGMVEGVDDGVDAVAFVGFHASEGKGPGILAHTFTGALDMKLNGRVVPEGGFAAAIAGEFGVPVVFVSGDQVIAHELTQLVGPIETAVVKEAIGFFSAEMLHPEVARRLIQAGVKRGVERRSEIDPFRLDGPVVMELRWENPVMVEILELAIGVERIDGRTVTFEGEDMLAVARFFELVHHVRSPH